MNEQRFDPMHLEKNNALVLEELEFVTKRVNAIKVDIFSLSD